MAYPKSEETTVRREEGAETRRRDELTPHPNADIVPPLAPRARAAFVADVAAHGVLTPLEVTAAGIVLDGHERLQAARELGLDVVTVRVVAPRDECAYMLRAALTRKHLDESQRAALALELDAFECEREQARARQRANLKQNAEVATLPPRGERTRERFAQIADVSPRTIQDVSTVRDADPDLFAEVKAGRLPAHRAAERIRRARRLSELGPAPPLPPASFELIYADPPWRSSSPGSRWAPEKHYPTMATSEIAALAVPASPDAVLFLWAVNGLLPDALAVMEAWGFEYRTNLVWVKDWIGLGFWARNRHELLLVGRRGGFPVPDEADRPDSVIEAPRGRHSEKPAAVYELLERMYPDASKLELFARQTRSGWSAWGNEVGR